MNLSLEWTKHAKDQKETEAVKDLVSNSKRLLKLFDVIVTKRIENAYRNSLKQSNYGAGWPYKQAETNGYVRALTEIKDLVNSRPTSLIFTEED